MEINGVVEIWVQLVTEYKGRLGHVAEICVF